MEKEMKKGPDKALDSERTVFNDEEQRRYVLLFLCTVNWYHLYFLLLVVPVS